MDQKINWEVQTCWITRVNSENCLKGVDPDQDYLGRHENGSKAAFGRLRDRIGTISVMTDLQIFGEIVYGMLKSRTQME